MKEVCVDTTALAISGAGVRRVLAEAASALAAHPPAGPRLRFFPFSPRSYAGGGHRGGAKPVRRAVRPAAEGAVRLWARLGRPSIDRFLGDASLYQISEYIPYPVKGPRQMAIVHDLSALRHPEWCDPASVGWKRARLEYIAEHCVHVVVPSAPVRDAWLSFTGWQEKRVSLIPWGVAPSFRRRGVGEIEHAKDRLRLKNPYVLHVGTIEPRKNLTCLLHAFERAARKLPKDFDLVLAGPRGWRTELFDEALSFASVRNRVRLLGAVAEEYLPALLSGASCLVLPSHEEGFGLAALEALACGTPVVSTQVACLPAELQPWCLRVGGGEEETLADTLLRVAGDAALAERSLELAAPAARQWTWDRVASALGEVYKSLA